MDFDYEIIIEGLCDEGEVENALFELPSIPQFDEFFAIGADYWIDMTCSMKLLSSQFPRVLFKVEEMDWNAGNRNIYQFQNGKMLTAETSEHD